MGLHKRHITALFYYLLIGFIIIPFNGYSYEASEMVAFAKKKLGAPYRYGGKGPNSFDCSGFTQYVFNEFNVSLEGSSYLQYEQGEKIKAKRAKVGDLIFFKSSNLNSSKVGHVGIICEVSEENDTLWFIHASTSNGVRIDQYPGYDYYNQRYVGCKRIVEWEEDEKSEDKNDDNQVRDDELCPEDPIMNPDIIEDDKEKQDEEVKPVPAPKPSPTPAPQPIPTEKGKIHIVKKGETLYRIAKKHKCTIEDIQSWNNLTSINLTIGQKLIILKGEKKAPKKKEKSKPSPEEKDKKRDSLKEKTSDIENQIIHIVKKGETLYRISKIYDCTIEELEKWNNLKSNKIDIEQKLIIRK